MKDKHCSHCGAAHVTSGYPKKCPSCGGMAFSSQFSVAICIVSLVDENLVPLQSVLTKRAIPPQVGEWCFASGYAKGAYVTLEGEKVDGEDWATTANREFHEETGILLDVRRWHQMGVANSTGNANMMLVTAYAVHPPEHEDFLAQIAAFTPNDEVSEVKLVNEFEPCAFPIHEKILAALFGPPATEPVEEPAEEV